MFKNKSVIMNRLAKVLEDIQDPSNIKSDLLITEH